MIFFPPGWMQAEEWRYYTFNVESPNVHFLQTSIKILSIKFFSRMSKRDIFAEV